MPSVAIAEVLHVLSKNLEGKSRGQRPSRLCIKRVLFGTGCCKSFSLNEPIDVLSVIDIDAVNWRDGCNFHQYCFGVFGCRGWDKSNETNFFIANFYLIKSCWIELKLSGICDEMLNWELLRFWAESNNFY